MTVYIDDMYLYAIGHFHTPHGPTRMSHMIADRETELHALAGQIGMRREWYQGDHYDVPLHRRGEALRHGAVAITYRQAGAMRRRLVVEGICGAPDEAVAWYRTWIKNNRS